MTQRSKIDFGSDQNVGLSGRVNQADAVQAELIRPNLWVGAVADGGENDRPGKIAISRLWRVLKGATNHDPIGTLLAKGLAEANQALWQENEEKQSRLQAGLTVVAVQNNRLYLAHIGSGRAYLVRGQQVIQLTDDQPKQALGLSPTPQAQFKPNLPDNRLRAGDRIVLGSDGLGRLRPGSQTPFLEPSEMPAVVNNPNVPALEAARTLVSLAVGRKANDNVSVVVMGLSRPGVSPLLVIGLALLVIGLLAVGGLAVVSGNRPTPTPTPTTAPPTLTPTPVPSDPGTLFVKSVTGRVWQQGGDGQRRELSGGKSIPVGDTILTEADGQISLSLTDGSLVYLPAGGQIRLDQLDLETEPNKTVLVLLSGRVLLERPATSTEQLIVIDAAGNILTELSEAGIVAVTAEQLVACLSGRCGPLAAPQTLDQALRDEWQPICNCLPSP